MRKNTPFRGELVSAGYTDSGCSSVEQKIRAIEGDPNKIVRITDPDDVTQNRDIFEVIGIERTAQIAQREYRRLRDEFGLAVNASFIVGSYSGKKVIYGITDRVTEKDGTLEDVDSASQGVMLSIISYFSSVLETQDAHTGDLDYFLWDITGVSQYVYGVTQSDGEPKLHLVDIDPDWLGSIVKDLSDSLLYFMRSFVEDYVARNREQTDFSLELKRRLSDLIQKCEECANVDTSRRKPYSIQLSKDLLREIFQENVAGEVF